MNNAGENGIIGMEIKSRKEISKTDITSIKEIASCLGKEWCVGLIIYRGNEIKKVAEPDIWIIPSRRLFIAA